MAATLDAQKCPGRDAAPEQVFCNGLALLSKANALYYGILIQLRKSRFWAAGRVYGLEKRNAAISIGNRTREQKETTTE